MDWIQATGQWNDVKGKLREQFGELTDDDLLVVDGQRDQLVGRIQQRYGYPREEAERRVDEIIAAL